MENKLIGKYVIVKDLNFSDYMKDEAGQIKTYDSYQEANEVCGIYEFEDVLIMKIVANYKEPQ